MASKKDLIIAVLSTFCLTATLFMIMPTRSSSSGVYDPWIDYNDDGIIDMKDITITLRNYGITGDPINKTEMMLRMETDPFKSGLLLTLPYAASHYAIPLNCYAILHSLDIDSSKPGDQQSIFVRENVTIFISGTFQVYSREGASGNIDQVFFIYSWTPSWPPPNSTYYHALYDDIPGLYPGVTQSFSFSLTVPNVDRSGSNAILYLYFCSTWEFSMQDAVIKFTKPLWTPYAVIVVGP